MVSSQARTGADLNRTPTNCYVLCMPSTSICPLSIFCLQGLCRVAVTEEYLPELPTCGIEPPAQAIRTRTLCFSCQLFQPFTSYHSFKNYLYQLKAKERHHCRPSDSFIFLNFATHFLQKYSGCVMMSFSPYSVV